MLCIRGQILADQIGRGHGILHELPDQLATLKLLTKWSKRINAPADAAVVMAKAFRRLTTGRPRPVAVETPWAVFGMKGSVDLDVGVAGPEPAPPDPDLIAEATKLLKAARNPMIMVGAGARHAGEEVLELARILQAPVVAHRGGRGIVSEKLPYGFSCATGYAHWQSTDLLLGIGTRMELAYFRWGSAAHKFKLIRIDIDPEEMERRPPDVGIVTDARLGTGALVEAASRAVGIRPSRTAEFDATKSMIRAQIKTVQPQMSFLDVIRDVLPSDGFFVEEIAQIGFAARYGFPVYEPRTYVNSGYQDNLGFGFNTALGVKVANPDKCVVSVSGDGGFMFGAQELATAVHHNIGVVSLVFNNRSFGNVLRDQQTQFDGRLIGYDLTNPDFVKFAESFGVAAYRSETPQALKHSLEFALAPGEPALIEVPQRPGGEASPWPFLMPEGPAADP